MKLKAKFCIGVLFFVCMHSYAQIEQYNYKRPLTGVADQWHKIVLPDEVLGKLSSDLSDMRIYGIKADNDTIEAPYLLRFKSEKAMSNDVRFKVINVSRNEKGYYFTFEISSDQSVNQINLDFKQENFDWKLKLEGSQNQEEWYTILEDYRIVSIKNEITDFQFTKIVFPDSRYRFIRLLIDSEEKPLITSSKVLQYDQINGVYKTYSKGEKKVIHNKERKQTEIDIQLYQPVPVNRVKLYIKDTFDYYRPITIQYLSDSIKTEKGWKFHYTTLLSGMLTSLEENEFTFDSAILKKLRIIIHNQNNQPLSIDTINVQGYIYELVARFTEQATYFLVYNSDKASKARYDIENFANKIPETMSMITLGSEQTIDKDNIPVNPPFFNKVWLWVVLGLIILVLGWFSVKMIMNKQAS